MQNEQKLPGSKAAMVIPSYTPVYEGAVFVCSIKHIVKGILHNLISFMSPALNKSLSNH